jgi:hypothetical protein
VRAAVLFEHRVPLELCYGFACKAKIIPDSTTSPSDNLETLFRALIYLVPVLNFSEHNANRKKPQKSVPKVAVNFYWNRGAGGG